MSRKSQKKNSKAPKENCIRMQIDAPMRLGRGISDIVAIVIPENKPGSTAPIELGISFTNNTSFPFGYYKNLVPELVAPDGQLLEPIESINRQHNTRSTDWISVSRGLPVGITLKARFFWQNNSLQLQIPTNSHYWGSPAITPENSWTFDALEPGIYKLRFVCEILSSEVLSSNLETRHLAELEGITIDKLATHEVYLRLVHPMEDNKNAVEVDGIRFETLVPKQTLNIPKKESGATDGLDLAGIRITNNTLNPMCFSFYVTVIPEIVGANGQILFRSYFCDWSRQVQESDFVLILPGKNVDFFPRTALWWQQNDQVTLVIDAEDGGTYTFQFPELGTYKIQLNYVNTTAAVKVYDQKTINWKPIEKIWTGMVSTPFIKFHITRP